MSFVKMKFFIAIILLAACVAVQGHSVQIDLIIPMRDYRMGFHTKILHGHDAHKGQFPWQAVLIIRKPAIRWYCGGSLISYNWVLTAAHCLIGATSVEVQLGNVERRTGMEYKETSYKFLLHKNYIRVLCKNDIALVELPIPAVKSANVRPVALPARSQLVPAGSTVRASGYGAKADHKGSIILQWVDLTAIKNSECEVFRRDCVWPSTLCTRGNPRHNTCRV